MKRSEAGFTLIELMVVIGIVAVLLSILTLGLRRAIESFELRRAASTAAAEIRNAQAGALTNHVDYVVEFGTSAAGGPPGSLAIYRPGVPVMGTVSVTSSGSSDGRSVTVVGVKNGVGMVSDTLFLNGTAAITSPVAFDWILEADTPQPNSCCTISIKQGATTLATIAPSQPSAIFPWTQIRTVRVPDWPQQVRMDAGGTTPLPSCSAYGGPMASANRCLRLRALGYPDQAGMLPLVNRAGVARCIVVAAGTGKVRIDLGACP